MGLSEAFAAPLTGIGADLMEIDVYKRQHPDWWQDKKNPDRHGIRIPVLDENGVQKVGARNRKPVSYTHLDVYKRQVDSNVMASSCPAIIQ